MDDRNLLTLFDWFSIAAYLLVMMGMGYYFSRRQISTEHYFVASSKIPGWAMGISMFATLLSSFTFVAFPGFTYERDWQILMREFMAPFTLVICAILIIPIYRRSIKMSAYEYLEHRYGYLARVYGVINFLVGHFAKIGVVFFAMGVALHSITGWNLQLILIVLGIITVAYTLAGGIEGVIWTDVIQGLLMIFSGLLTIVIILFVLSPDGPGAVFEAAASHDKFKLAKLKFSWTEETAYIFMFMGLYHFLTKYATDQTMVQRYMLAPSVKDTIRGSFVSILCCMVAWSTFALIGSLLFGFYELFPDRLADDITRADQVFPFFIGNELPVGLTGVVLAGLISATMSTLSSDLNSVGAVAVSDFYDRFAKNPDEKARLLISKILVGLTGIAAIGLALGISLFEGGIMEFSLELAAYMGSIMGGGMLALFMLGFFTRRTNKQGMYTGLGLGIIVVLWCLGTRPSPESGQAWIDYLVAYPEGLDFLRYRIHHWWLPGISNVLVFGVAYGASRLFGGALCDRHLTAYRHRDSLVSAVTDAVDKEL